MKNHKHIQSLLDRAELERRCAYGRTEAERKALLRRYHAGELTKPYRNIYARQAYWKGINPNEREIHLARTLALLHPDWVFTGLTAASICGFEHPWELHDGKPTIAAISCPARRPVRRIYTPTSSVHIVQGLRVTSPEQTLLHCASMHPFTKTLGMFDSALRMKAVTKESVTSLCDSTPGVHEPARLLLRYADERSENGGESRARAVMIENGFQIPQLQVEFVDPNDPSCRRLVDFAWRLNNGNIIVVEYDGVEKFVSPDIVGRKDAQCIVEEERARERMLQRAGVIDIGRLWHEDVVESKRMVNKLLALGVPTIDDRWARRQAADNPS